MVKLSLTWHCEVTFCLDYNFADAWHSQWMCPELKENDTHILLLLIWLSFEYDFPLVSGIEAHVQDWSFDPNQSSGLTETQFYEDWNHRSGVTKV